MPLLASAACCALDDAQDARVASLRTAGVSLRQVAGLDELDEPAERAVRELDAPLAPERPKRPRPSRSPTAEPLVEPRPFDVREARFRRRPWDGKAVRCVDCACALRGRASRLSHASRTISISYSLPQPLSNQFGFDEAFLHEFPALARTNHFIVRPASLQTDLTPASGAEASRNE